MGTDASGNIVRLHQQPSAPCAMTQRLLPESVAKFLLYSSPPFFGHPLKPVWNAAEAVGFKRAYQHFAAQHQDATNLFLHFFPCFWFQAINNFALLSEFDSWNDETSPREAFGGRGTLVTATLLLWAGFMLVQTFVAGKSIAERTANAGIGATAGILLWAASAPWLSEWVRENWLLLAFATPTIEVPLLLLKLRTAHHENRPRPSNKELVKLALSTFPVRLILTFGFMKLAEWTAGPMTGLAPTLARYCVYILVLVFLAWTSQDAFNKKVTPFHSGLFVPFMAVALNDKWLFLFATGYTATVLQGLVHELCFEAPTLSNLHRCDDELAHVAFFPALLLKRMADHCLQTRVRSD
mmetsp:Transcript_5226/g.15405  ORF Transcript_5226/g.15405 Transcript_5226/m.15405 type:complete len:353 (+) Transcript_5226:57-1115(+)